MRVTRRRLLKGATFAALAAGASAVAIVRTRGYSVAPDRAAKLAVLSPWQLVVVGHAARRICAPDAGYAPSPDDLDVASFVDAWMAKLPARPRRDLARFVAYVEHVAPLGRGFASRFTRLSPVDQDRVLASIESSSNDLLRAGFEGLKALVLLGYYRDARSWGIVGYDGPLVNRPAGGWK